MVTNFDTKQSSELKQVLKQLQLKLQNKKNNFNQNELLLIIKNFDFNDFVFNTQLLNEIMVILNDAYFKLANPLVDDSIYDEIEHILLVNNFDVKALKHIGSSLEEKSGLKKKSHSMPMLSLDKLLSIDDVDDFIKKINRYLNSTIDYTYCVEPKIDGNSLSLIYKKGNLVEALTRGDGYIGEDVIDVINVIDSIPKILPQKIDIEIRGEIFITKSNFLYINNEREKIGEKLFANPRNMVAGSLRNLDVSIAKNRNLEFIPWGFGEVEKGVLSNSYYENLAMLKNYGFTLNKYNKICKNIAEAILYYENLAKIRYEIDYDIDGVVFKIDDINIANRLGFTEKAPRWAAAYKFESQGAYTKITDITLQIGRTGVITPVAELSPINVGGVLISRATLHNFDYITQKDIRINDKVFIKRAGDVIPQVVQVDLSSRNNLCVVYKIPTNCPSCGSKLIKEEDGVAFKCSFDMINCAERKLKFLEHLVSKKAFNIIGLSEKQLKIFLENKLIDLPSDIFELSNKKDKLLVLEGFKEKSVSNLLSSIDKSKSITLDKLIYALGIPQVGEKVSKILAKNYKTFDNLLTNTINNNLHNIDGIGESIYKDLKHYLMDSSYSQMIENLLQKIVVLDYIDNNNQGVLSGKKILFTGTLSINRSEAKNLAEKNGAIILSAVSKNLDILVCGENPGSKLEIAKQLEILILTEKEFLDFINQVDYV